METGGRPDCGVCAAVDVHYPKTGGARAAAVLAADAAFTHVLAERTAVVPRGCPQPTRRTWSGAWPAGTGCPAHYAAPIPSRGRARPQPR